MIVTCQEGYTSSLAAAALQDLGLPRATDLDGGFAAWQAAGLPTLPDPAPLLIHSRDLGLVVGNKSRIGPKTPTTLQDRACWGRAP